MCGMLPVQAIATPIQRCEGRYASEFLGDAVNRDIRIVLLSIL